MAAYRPGEIAELLGVSVDTVRRWADDGLLDTERSSGGHRVIDGASVARFLTERGRQAVDRAPAQSARNRFLGIVTKVERDTITALVEIQAGPHRIVSLMTREAADELSLAPGELAVAAVKSTNVIVEAPTER